MFNMSYIYPMTREEKNAKQRLTRLANGNLYTKRYEKTKRGFLMRLYRNMNSRINGVQKQKFHLYCGKELLPKSEFYSWAMANSTFHELFEKYERSNYDRKLAPGVDRIDPSRGYCLENMEFVTHSENSRRSSITRSLTAK